MQFAGNCPLFFLAHRLEVVGQAAQPVPEAPSAWLPYVVVDDLKATTEKAVSLGATVLMDVTAIPGMGHYSIIQDPTGAAIGLWQMA